MRILAPMDPIALSIQSGLKGAEGCGLIYAGMEAMRLNDPATARQKFGAAGIAFSAAASLAQQAADAAAACCPPPGPTP